MYTRPARSDYVRTLKAELVKRTSSETPALRGDKLDSTEIAFDEQDRWFMMTRAPITIACNLGPSTQVLPVPNAQSRTLLIASHGEARLSSGELHLPTEAVAIIGPE
jgi:hypothetical protein